MSLSAEVNVDLLASCFELGPFHGLRKVNEADTWEERTATGTDLREPLVFVTPSCGNNRKRV